MKKEKQVEKRNRHVPAAGESSAVARGQTLRRVRGRIKQASGDWSEGFCGGGNSGDPPFIDFGFMGIFTSTTRSSTLDHFRRSKLHFYILHSCIFAIIGKCRLWNWDLIIIAHLRPSSPTVTLFPIATRESAYLYYCLGPFVIN